MPTSMYLRYKALNEDMSHYSCCQGYYDCMCWKAGSLGEKDMAWPCLCLEAWCFPSCAISSTRMLVMDTRNIQPDPCDSRLIRLNNFLQILSICCDLLTIIDDVFMEAAIAIDFAADIFYALVSSCMQAQVDLEIKKGGHTDFSRMAIYPRNTSRKMAEYAGGSGPTPGGAVPQQMRMGGGRPCAACHAPLSPGERFCSSCGTPA